MGVYTWGGPVCFSWVCQVSRDDSGKVFMGVGEKSVSDARISGVSTGKFVLRADERKVKDTGKGGFKEIC